MVYLLRGTHENHPSTEPKMSLRCSVRIETDFCQGWISAVECLNRIFKALCSFPVLKTTQNRTWKTTWVPMGSHGERMAVGWYILNAKRKFINQQFCIWQYSSKIKKLLQAQKNKVRDSFSFGMTNISCNERLSDICGNSQEEGSNHSGSKLKCKGWCCGLGLGCLPDAPVLKVPIWGHYEEVEMTAYRA